jgi:hypothetical protein
MPHEEYKLTAADPRDLAKSVALALRFFEGRKRNHDGEAFRATAQRSVLQAISSAPASSSCRKL